ncbi:MAG: hypothetical protein MJE66_22385 [Proteobacteria bacterium]|nr:hypothetical protein [Pseudomonadota bacterium]
MLPSKDLEERRRRRRKRRLRRLGSVVGFVSALSALLLVALGITNLLETRRPVRPEDRIPLPSYVADTVAPPGASLPLLSPLAEDELLPDPARPASSDELADSEGWLDCTEGCW